MRSKVTSPSRRRGDCHEVFSHHRCISCCSQSRRHWRNSPRGRSYVRAGIRERTSARRTITCRNTATATRTSTSNSRASNHHANLHDDTSPAQKGVLQGPGRTSPIVGGWSTVMVIAPGMSYCSEATKHRFEDGAAGNTSGVPGARVISSKRRRSILSPGSRFWPATTETTIALPDPRVPDRFYTMASRRPGRWTFATPTGPRREVSGGGGTTLQINQMNSPAMVRHQEDCG
jgi:hypothetical protein